jgi:hypothetical protein
MMHACALTDPDVPLDIVLHTPGGLMLASLQIARAVRHRKSKVTVFVLDYAMSGAWTTRRSSMRTSRRRRSISLRESTAELLTRSMPAEKAKELAARFSTGTWTHDYPITVEEAQRLGLDVRSGIDADVLQRMTLYPQHIRRQPTVEYLLGQRHAPPKREVS